jgi:hypothetical protein
MGGFASQQLNFTYKCIFVGTVMYPSALILLNFVKLASEYKKNFIMDITECCHMGLTESLTD